MPFYTCGPNEVIVVSGCCLSKPYTLTGGRVYAFPGLHLVQRMSLNLMTVVITSPRIYTKLGVPLTVTGVAQVKISSANKQMLNTACQLFLSKTDEEMLSIVRETLESHQRSIIGMMTVEEIYKDRKKFSVSVFDVASSDLLNMGIVVVSYCIKDIKDERSYLASLGQARIAQVKRDARIGEADAKRDASIKQSIAQQETAQHIFEANSEIAKAERDLNAQASAYEQEVRTRKAQADSAYSLHAARVRQSIREAEMEIKVVERSQQIRVAEQEILRVERELDAQVKKPSDAERYRLELLADANARARVVDAEARAEAIRLRGEAQADALDGRGRAQAIAMELKADSFAEFGDAGRLSLVLNTLPGLAHEVSEPLLKCKRIAFVSNGGEQIGAAKLTGEITQMITRLPNLVRSLTGYSMIPSDSNA